MWDRIKAFFSRRKTEERRPPATQRPEPVPAGPEVRPAPGDTDPGPAAPPPVKASGRDPLVERADALFLEARQLAHSLKLEATIGISNVQQRYKLARQVAYTDAGLRNLHEPIMHIYSEKLGQELLLLALARSLRRKFHKIVADALESTQPGASVPVDLRDRLYHLTRAEELAVSTKLCLGEARRTRETGDSATAEGLCAYQVELLQRQLNVRVPLEDALAKAAVHQWMGFVYQAQGKPEAAEAAFRQADEINPPQDEYRDPVAEALGEWGTLDLDDWSSETTGPVPAGPTPEPALSASGPVQRTPSELLRLVELPQPPDIFSEA